MARNPFVRPETVRLELAEGDWIEVKKFLTSGEDARMSGAGLRQMQQGEGGKPTFILDFERLGLAQIEAYVVAWSFVDEKGRSVPVTPSNIGALSKEVAKEIGAAIDKHIESLKAVASDPS
jgi:hypothetical protein